MGSRRAAVARLACAAILVGLVANPADARRRFGAHLEGGFGPTVVRPLERERAPGATACAGITAPLIGRLRAGLELAATAGGDSRHIVIPEDSRPGDRSLTTFLIGIETSARRDERGPFAFAGTGVGHSTLKNARGVFAPPYGDNWFIPSRSLTAFALGAGAGYRFGGGPGPFGFQFGFRTHALVDAGRTPASAWAFTVGLAY